MPLNKIDTGTIVSRNQKIIHTKMDDEIVMVNLERGEYYGLDGIASDIWEMLEEETSVQSLCEELGSKYGIDPGQCLDDTLPFLQEMAEYGAIRLS